MALPPPGPLPPDIGAAAAVAAGAAAAPTVEWEGTRYRVDLAAAEASRLERLRGEQARPYLSAARVLVAMADALSDSALARDRLRREAGEFERVAQAVGWTEAELWTRGDARVRSRDLASALQRAAKEGSAAGAARLAPAVLALADDLFARGLMELAYAVAMGQPEGLGFSADEIAGRHDFGLYAGRVRHRYGPWELPVAAADSKRPWGGTGSLLGLDVAFAPLSLVRLSSRLPSKPTLDEEDRRALIRNVALVRETALSDAQRDTIVAAIHEGRARLAAARTPDEGAAIAEEAILDGPRRSLLPWIVARDPERVAAFLSTGELFRLGLARAPIDARLHAWGAPAEPRLGCLCLQIPDRGVVERAAGRWGTGIFVSAFPDFNLRLAELLAELRMPAPLLRAVLTSATLEFVNGTNSRDSDDRRALVEYVQALTLERLEQYLALLTTGGPLVPLGRAADAAATGSMGVPR